MKLKLYIIIFFFGSLLIPEQSCAQVDSNKLPTDDLGNVTDKYQEYFFEALKQKGIENYDKAIDALLKCIEINNTDAVLFFELGKNYNKLKNYDAAETALKKATQKQPENEWYLDELYDVYSKQNDIENALKTVQQLVKFHPDYKQDLASLYIKAKRYDESLKLLSELDRDFGISKKRDQLRDTIYTLTGRENDRIENLKQRLKSDPNNEKTYISLIYRYSEKGEKDKAFAIAKKLLSINPYSHLVHLALYKFYLDENDTQNAITSMKTVITSDEIDPNAKAKTLKDFMSFVSKNPEFEPQLIEITALVETDNNEKSLLELAQYYLSINDKPKALQYFEKALNENPNDFNSIKNVLLLQIELNQNDDALKSSNSALEIFPAQPLLYLINGVANNNLKQPQKAIESLETGLDYIIEDTKMEADFYKQLSIAYKLNNNISKSEAFSKKAAALSKKL